MTLDSTKMRAYLAVMFSEIPRRQWAKNMDIFEEVFASAADLIRTKREPPVKALIECVINVAGKQRSAQLTPYLKMGETMFKATPVDEIADWVLEFVACGKESYGYLAALER